MSFDSERFVVSIDPVAGESLPGFVTRLAQRARQPKADLVAAKAGLRQPGLAFLYASLSGLSTLSGVGIEKLDAIAYGPTDRPGHYRFLDGVLQREFIDLSRRRSCPACLDASVHHRATWDFALATCCPEHGIRLISDCPACKRPLGWHHPDLNRCRCGAVLNGSSIQPVTANERISNATLLAIATGGPFPVVSAGMATCHRADLVRLVMCLGMFLSGWDGERRVETLTAAGPDAVANVIQAGIGCLRDWPGGLHRFFASQLAGIATRRGKYGARKALGPFYDWLNTMAPGPIRTTVAQAASDFLTADPKLARLAHRSGLVAASISAPDRPVSMMEAGRRIGVCERQVRKLAGAGLLKGTMSNGPGSIGLLDGAEVQRLAELAADALDLESAARRLGTSKARIRRLVQGGVIVPVHRGNADGWGHWMFTRISIDELVLSLASRLRPGAGETVPFETAIEILRRRGIDLPGVLRAVLGDSLPVAGLDDDAIGLKAFRFRAHDVRGLARARRKDSAFLSIQAAAHELDLKWQVVSDLVKAGLIRREPGGIPAAALANFRADFVSGADLAKLHKTSPRNVAAILEQQGVCPVVGPEIDGARQNFFRRNSLSDGGCCVD